MATRDELIAATVVRYAAASKMQRGLILDEFASITGPQARITGFATGSVGGPNGSTSVTSVI